MARIATSIEESKRLLELGISRQSADMFWYTSEIDEFYEKEHPKLLAGKPPVAICSHLTFIPAWSLTALLKVLPSGKILVNDKRTNTYKVICKNIDSDIFENPVDACIDMICKLKNGGQNNG